MACLAFNVPRVRTAFSGAATGLTVLLLGTLLANSYFYAGLSIGYVLLLVEDCWLIRWWPESIACASAAMV